MTDLNKIIDQLSKLTVVEAAELSKQLEEKWGVTAAAPMAAAPAAAAAAPPPPPSPAPPTALHPNQQPSTKARGRKLGS